MTAESPKTVRSSAQFDAGQFRPHGHFQIRVEGAIVHSIAQGPFNPEFVKVLGLARDDVLKSLQVPRIHAHFVELRTSMLASPEVLEEFSRFLAAVEREPLMAGAVTAWVLPPDIEGREFMTPLFERVFAAHGRTFRVFEQMAEAQAWVQSLAERGA